MNFKDNNGNVISPEELTDWEREFDAGDYSKWDTSAPVKYGEYPIHRMKETTVLNITLPVNMKEKMVEASKEKNCSTSDYVREAIANQILADSIA